MSGQLELEPLSMPAAAAAAARASCPLAISADYRLPVPDEDEMVGKGWPARSSTAAQGSMNMHKTQGGFA